MLPRIRDSLDEALKPFDLDVGSRIFENSIATLANLDLREDKKKNFYLRKPVDNAGCRFIAPSLNENNRDKLLKFCGQPSTKTIQEEIFEINEDRFKSIILPLFLDYVSTLKNNQPDVFKLYQTRSSAIFEKHAIKQMKEHVPLLLNELNIKTSLTEQEEIGKLILSRLVNTLNKLINYYMDDYHSLSEKLNEFKKICYDIENSAIRSNNQYSDKIEKILNNLKSFLHYSPIHDYVKWHFIHFSLNKSLADVKISTSACDIFEHVLLDLAQITQFGDRCRFEIDGKNPSCMLLRIPNLSIEDSEKLLQFLHQNNAKSAKIIFSLFETVHEKEMKEDENGRYYFIYSEPFVDYNIHLNEVIDHILPLFSTKIDEIKKKNPARLLPYQQESTQWFKEEEIAETKVVKDTAINTSLESTSTNISSTLFYKEKKTPAQEATPEKINTASQQPKTQKHPEDDHYLKSTMYKP